MRVVTCPVCEGRGALSSGGGTNDLLCYGCNGKGWVEVSEDVEIFPEPKNPRGKRTKENDDAI